MVIVRSYQMKEKQQIKCGSSRMARMHRLRLGAGCKLELLTTCRVVETRLDAKEVSMMEGGWS